MMNNFRCEYTHRRAYNIIYNILQGERVTHREKPILPDKPIKIVNYSRDINGIPAVCVCVGGCDTHTHTQVSGEVQGDVRIMANEIYNSLNFKDFSIVVGIFQKRIVRNPKKQHMIELEPFAIECCFSGFLTMFLRKVTIKTKHSFKISSHHEPGIYGIYIVLPKKQYIRYI